MKTTHGNRLLALSLTALALVLGFAAWAQEPAETAAREGEPAAEAPDAEGVQGLDARDARAVLDLLDPVRLAARYSEPGSFVRVDEGKELAAAARCNCNLPSGIGFCAVGQTCQPCPCLSTAGSFFNALCK